MSAAPPIIKSLGRIDCGQAHVAMRAFTEARTADTPDEIWLCEHPAVYTQGIAGKADHVLNPAGIPVLATNRGGQVTFHGPGQVVAYPLIDLRRLGIYVKEYVFRIEQAVLKTLEAFDVTGHRVPGAPGIYVRVDDPRGHARLDARSPAEQHAAPLIDPFSGLGKIAALGVKVSQHCTYHGVALNVAMDLRPFDGINPCGYAGLRTVDLATLGVPADWATVAPVLGQKLATYLTP